ncbi:hypothetical protein T01_8718 [Trichinella spiralis]|uniref:Uncharacterized protein n=1 Tax=Trichinella spiralis TaxID=6334 RepID=A0A0V1B6I2_TRISP|nr:hypothetical protein T01_1539 [Trichinella spiralis]KRY32635.1 hypothetical protein T01_8718 [Trichinella spiralis]
MKKGNSLFTESKWVPLLWKNYLEENHSKRCDAMERQKHIGAVAPISCLVGEAAKPSPPEAAAEHAFSFSGSNAFKLKLFSQRTSDTSPVEYIVSGWHWVFCCEYSEIHCCCIWSVSSCWKCTIVRIVSVVLDFASSYFPEPFSELVCFLVVNGHENDHSGGIRYVDTCRSVWLSFQLFKSNLRLVTPRRNLNEFIIFVVDRVILAGFHFELNIFLFFENNILISDCKMKKNCRDCVQQQRLFMFGCKENCLFWSLRMRSTEIGKFAGMFLKFLISRPLAAIFEALMYCCVGPKAKKALFSLPLLTEYNTMTQSSWSNLFPLHIVQAAFAAVRLVLPMLRSEMKRDERYPVLGVGPDPNGSFNVENFAFGKRFLPFNKKEIKLLLTKVTSFMTSPPPPAPPPSSSRSVLVEEERKDNPGCCQMIIVLFFYIQRG